MHPRNALLSLSTLALTASSVQGQCEQQKLLASDPAPGQKFGLDLAHSGGFAIVGAPFDPEAGAIAGAAYMMELGPSGWTILTKHVASDGEDFDRTGWRVAIDGDMAVSSTRYSEDAGYGTGAVYVIERQPDEQWVETAKVLADDAAAFTFFGNAVDVSTSLAGVEGVIAVGAPSDDPAGALSGSAYVFERSGGVWSQSVKLGPSATGDEDRFGYALSLDGDTLAVGSYGHDTNGILDAGAVFMFERIGGVWTETAMLSASDASTDAAFGIDVSLDGDRLLVGAHLEDTVANNAGAAYVFERSGGVWSEVAQLRDTTNGVAADFFGETVALGEDWALIGAFGADASGANSGAAYLYAIDGSTWTLSERLLASDIVPGDAFGTSVSVDGDSLLIGSRDDSFGLDAGAVYAFTPKSGLILESDTGKVSLSTGGTQDMQLSTCPARPGNLFFVLGTAGGTTPGLDLGNLHIPLNPDFYFTLSVTSPNTYPLIQTTGVLDAAGQGTAVFGLNDSESPTLAGVALNHAFGLIDPQGAVVTTFSNPLQVRLVP